MSKIVTNSIEGLNDEDVRLNKRKGLSTRRMRGFKKGKIGPKDGKDHIGGNYAAAINIEMNLPKLLPDSTNFDVGLFFDSERLNHAYFEGDGELVCVEVKDD